MVASALQRRIAGVLSIFHNNRAVAGYFDS
jgi:hypothetical protein